MFKTSLITAHNNAILRSLPNGKTYAAHIVRQYQEAQATKRVYNGYDFRIHKIGKLFLVYSFRFSTPLGTSLFTNDGIVISLLNYLFKRSNL